MADIGSLDKDLVYTPITPCRLLDTRNAPLFSSTPIAADSTRNFAVWNVSTFGNQGGEGINCGLTASLNTAAIAVNFTVVSPVTGGYITAFPRGAVRPVAATVNFSAGDIRGNSAIVKVSQTPAENLNLSVYSTSSTHLVADVVGYFSRPITKALNCNVVLAERQLAANFEGFTYTTAACAAGFTVVSANCYNSGGSNAISLTGSGTNGGGGLVWLAQYQRIHSNSS